MAVYTLINKSQFESILSYYDIGELLEYTPIKSGTANSNYEFITIKKDVKSKYVLTILEEKMSKAELDFCLEFTNYLSQNNIPIAHPVIDRHKNYYRMLIDKLVIITPFISGHHIMLSHGENNKLLDSHCSQLGTTLAKMHILGSKFSKKRLNPFGLKWCFKTFDNVMEYLPTETQDCINQEFEFLSKNHDVIASRNLLTGAIHADLFCDNILFYCDKLQGIIDFYIACNDYLLYDLAIAVNDFTITPAGQVLDKNYNALINSYIQALTQDTDVYTNLINNLLNNPNLWQYMLRRAALCFWLMRLEAYYLPRGEDIEHSVKNVKDPTEFEIKLLLHRTNKLKLNLE